MKTLTILTRWFLLVVCTDVLAQDYRCEDSTGGTLTMHISEGPAYEIRFETLSETFHFDAERSGNELLYTLSGPGDDDERYVTRELVRFDLQRSRLMYFRHEPRHLFLLANCERVDSDQ